MIIDDIFDFSHGILVIGVDKEFSKSILSIIEDFGVQGLV
jgi:hypothetical protein